VQLVDRLPTKIVEQVSSLLFENTVISPNVRFEILNQFPQVYVRQELIDFFDIWQKDFPTVFCPTVGFAIKTLLVDHSIQQEKNGEIKLIWTGPKTEHFTIRRTDQALLDIVKKAQNEIWLVSFAVYRIPELTVEIEKAIERGVEVCFLLETPESSNNVISYNPQQNFSTLIAEKAKFFIWPYEKRAVSDRGRRGVLHAKICISDQKYLLLSSANLTQHAMEINIEMGVYVERGELPREVSLHFRELFRQGEIVVI
jgi:phosphatidylserine/phosphatidylglycerophosphate/cardiolipin synthase-like enzyme